MTDDERKLRAGPPVRRAVLFLIDVEPDLRKSRDLRKWDGSLRALQHLENLRRRLEDRTNRRVEFNWFLRTDPQIEKACGDAAYVADACPQVLKTMADQKDSCGIHPHLWRWDARAGEWFNDFNDPGWTADCLYTSIEAFRKIFQCPPETCRFGDRWLNQHAVELMRASGIHYDLTIEPGLPDEPVFDDRRATSRLPDYRNAPREPYRPSKEDFLVPENQEAASGSLWMTPLTTSPPVRRFMRRPPHVFKASRSPNLALRPSHVWPHLRVQLESDSKTPLAMVVRGGDLGTPKFLANFLETTRQLVQHPALRDCEFTNPRAAVERWRKAL